MPEELGKRYPCFGEFQCPRCRRKWQSAKAWADYGQQCQSCFSTANVFNLQRLFVYICDQCKNEWKWAYDAQGRRCRNCSSSTLVRPMDPRNYADRQYIQAHRRESLCDLEDDEINIDPSREHRQDLCEKCQRLGRPCRETAGLGNRTANHFVRPQGMPQRGRPGLGYSTTNDVSSQRNCSSQETYSPPSRSNQSVGNRLYVDNFTLSEQSYQIFPLLFVVVIVIAVVCVIGSGAKS